MRTIIPAALAALLFSSTPSTAQTASPSSSLVEAKVSLESALESRLQAVLRKVLGTPDVLVVVRVDVESKSGESIKEILPGVPLKESPGLELASKGSEVVKQIRATVYLDEEASESKIALAEKTAKDVLGIRFGRGDTVEVQKLALAKQLDAAAKASFGERLLTPGSLFSLAWLVFAIMAIGVLLSKFITPLLSVLRTLAMAAQASPAAAPAPAAQAAAPAQPLQQPEVPKRLAREPRGDDEDGDEEELPFSFVRDRHLPMLKYLLRRAQPRTAAIVVHYLPAPMAAEVLATLEESARKEIVQNMSAIVQLDPENVDAIEDSLRDRLDYLMGGEDKLAEILDEVPVQLQQELLDAVRAKDAPLGNRLGRRIVTLEDIALLDANGLKTLSRRVPIRSLAAVLRASDSIRSRILPKLTSGLGQWLTQEIELSSDLQGDRLAEEQRKVLAALSALVREGTLELNRDDGAAAAGQAPLPEPAHVAALERAEQEAAAEQAPAPAEAPPAPEVGAPGVSEAPIPSPGEEKE
jgi:flagellar motor switch protein FliG